jgi:wyosine [tRNA(Phe)-imidazoG37] synthetase (radical SAM superfamily)
MKYNKFFFKIEKSNEEFFNSSKPEKRVRIAKDVLKRIEFDNLVPTTGHYIMTQTIIDIHNKNPLLSLKDIINSDISCEVCAKGAMFCAYIGRVNDFPAYNVTNWNNRLGNKLNYKILEIFTPKQLALIETAFEGKNWMQMDVKLNPNEEQKI